MAAKDEKDKTASTAAYEATQNPADAVATISDGTVGDLADAEEAVAENPPRGQQPALDTKAPKPEDMTWQERVRAGYPRDYDPKVDSPRPARRPRGG